MGRLIYMDNHATTPMDPRVLEAMLPYFTDKYGNAASRNHQFGWEAEAAVDTAREQIAELIAAKPKEIIFTSGATESNNLAIKGVVEFYKDKGNHIITATTEHKAILDTCKALERAGKATVTYLPVGPDGKVDPEDVRRAITDKTILISIMFANNEIGTIAPLAEIGRIAKEKGILFHSDATQGVGKIPFDVDAFGLDLVSFTGHKIYGPKGCGVLYVRSKGPRVRLVPQMDGGGHERGMRSGTLNVPGIVGLGRACEIARLEMVQDREKVLALRERLHHGLFSQLDELYLNGHVTDRLPGNLNVSFAYVEGESLLMGLKDIAVSSGSACTSATLEPSYVLRALGVGEELAHTSIRFGLGRFNTEEEVDAVVERVVHEVRRLRDMSPLYEMAKEGIDLKSYNWVREGVGTRHHSHPSGGGKTMAYSDKVIDHYENPRNVGSFGKEDENVGTGVVGAPECGDVMKLQLRITDEGVIEDARFKTFGCGSAIASSSYVTELVKGKTLDEALDIKNTQIVEDLSLPPVKIHCSVLAEDAIKAAIQDWKTRKGIEEPVEPKQAVTA